MKVTAVIKKFAKYSLLAAPLSIAPLVSGLIADAAGYHVTGSGVAFAQDQKQEKPKYKTRKTPAMRENVFKKLAVVQTLVSPEEEGQEPDFPKALEELKEIEENSSSKFNQYELAQMYNYYGFIYYTLEKYKNAIRYYEKVIAQSPHIPEGLELATLYTIAQLYFVQEDYKQGLKNLDKWMAASPIVGADAYALKSQGHYQINEMDEALESINNAVRIYEEKGKIPKENWFALQRALYYDKKDYKKVIKIMEKLVRHYPKMTYFRQLASIYGTVEQEKDQLHLLEAAYLKGGLTKEKELMNLAYLFMGQDVPYKAAKVVDKGINDKIIEDTAKNLEFLAMAWRAAQEVKKSIPEMEKAASKSKEGNLFARLASIYLDSEKNDKAIKAAKEAFKRGAVKRPDILNIVVGTANTNLGRYGEAIKAFKEAAKDKRSRRFADQWIKFCENEIKRKKQLDV